MKLLIISAMLLLLNAFPLPVDSVAPINDQQPTDTPSNSPSNDHDNQISAQNPSLDPLEDSFKQLPSDIQLKIYAHLPMSFDDAVKIAKQLDLPDDKAHLWAKENHDFTSERITKYLGNFFRNGRIPWYKLTHADFKNWPVDVPVKSPYNLPLKQKDRLKKITINDKYPRGEWNSYVLNMLNDMTKDFSDRPADRIIWSRIPWDSFTCWPEGIEITDPKSLTADELIRILKIKNKIKFTDKFRKLVLKSMKKGYITL